MPAQDDISDPTDWIATPVASLGPLEAGLRCEICKDFYTAPVLTACCHTFCSACIRRSLSSVNASRKCPLCWAPFDEGQLRKNKIVEELVKTFQGARDDILALGRAAKENVANGREVSKKRKLDEVDGAASLTNGLSPRKTRSQAQNKAALTQASRRSEEIVDEDSEQDTKSQNDDGNVSCPICQQRMPEAQVFTHLDTHSEDKATSNTLTSRLPTRAQATTPTMNPLPTISYNLLNETRLRKKLGELGIPHDGNKHTMSRRYTEWRNLVNANCDSSNPKSKKDLLKELTNWERTQNFSDYSHAAIANKSAVMDKDFDRDSWSTNHNTDFQSLIATAKTKAKASAAVEPKAVEKEMDIIQNEDLADFSRQADDHKELASIPSSSQVSMTALVDQDG